MAGHPLRSATDRRLGGPLPHQPANRTRAHPILPGLFTLQHALLCAYAVLAAISSRYPPVWGRLPTRYSPVRHSVNLASIRKLPLNRFVRLACVKHAASVHPEPGSNSQFLACFPVPFWRFRFFFNRSTVFGSFCSEFSGLRFRACLLNFQGFKHCSIFHFQGSSRCWLPQQQLVYLIISCEVCQQLFLSFFQKFLFLYFWTTISAVELKYTMTWE